MNMNFGKKFDVSKSPLDNKYRIFEWMTLSDITNDVERDNYKKWICVGVVDNVKDCKTIVDARENKENKEN